MTRVDVGAFLADAPSYRSIITVTAQRSLVQVEWQTSLGSQLASTPGDWVVTDGTSTWTVESTVFERTYRPTGDGRYVKTALVRARQLEHADTFQTLEGIAHANAGDWVVCNPTGEVWPVTNDEFARRYERVIP